MDTQFDAIPAPILSMTEGSTLPGFNLGVRAQSDEVYFTLDGTDPRLPNGKLNPLAKRLGQAEAEVIIPKGSEWRYLDTGIAQDKTDWKKLDFDDAAWPSGKSELGYGDGDEATAVERGPSPSSNIGIRFIFAGRLIFNRARSQVALHQTASRRRCGDPS